MGFRSSTIAVALTCCVLAPAPLIAAEWKAFGLPGITVRSLAATSDLLCAGTESGVFCRRLDTSGATTGWSSAGLPGVTVTWLWIDPLDTDVRFAAAGFAPVNTPTLFRTTNGGAHWVASVGFPATGARVYAVDGVPGSGTLFAAGAGIWISHDLGDTWSASSSDAALDCVEVSRADPDSVWSGGETVIFRGFTTRTLDGGATWQWVWDSRHIGDNQTADVSAHPSRDGLVLTGHEGFVLRTQDNGASFTQVLDAPSRFFLDWDGGNTDRAYAAGSPNGGTCHAFVSGDRGVTWEDVTGTILAPRTVFRIEGDEERVGVVYAATDDGVYRYYGGGATVCLDAIDGIDALRMGRGPCPSSPPGLPVVGDVIVVEPSRFVEGGTTLFLGEAECVADDADLAPIHLDTPDPAAGRFLAFLARPSGGFGYGVTSGGLLRRPTLGDCTP
jgi:hypothetical protein